jgi:hypothetical protein
MTLLIKRFMGIHRVIERLAGGAELITEPTPETPRHPDGGYSRAPEGRDSSQGDARQRDHRSLGHGLPP